MGRLGNEQEAEHEQVRQVLQSQKEAFDARSTQKLEQVTQSRTRITSMCPERKRVSKRASEASFSESNLRMVRRRWRRDTKKQRHGNKQMTLQSRSQQRQYSNMSKHNQGRRGRHLGETGCSETSLMIGGDRGSESMLWLASSYLEHEATIQEGVKRYHLCLNIFPRLKRRTERVRQRDSTSEFGLNFRYSERAY